MAQKTQLAIRKKRVRRIVERAADSNVLFYSIGAAGLGLLWWLYNHPRPAVQP